MSLTNSNQKEQQPAATVSPVFSMSGASGSASSSSSAMSSVSSGTTMSTVSLDGATMTASSHIDNSVHREGDKTIHITINNTHNHYGERVIDEESGASSSLDDELKRIQLEKARLECKQVALAVEREQVALEEKKMALEERRLAVEKEQVLLQNARLINASLMRQAEATLCGLPESGQALRVHNCQTDEEPQETSRSQSSYDGNTTPNRTKKNRSKRGRKTVDSSSRIPRKTNNKTQKSRLMNNSRGVVVDVSIKVPHGSRPIQLNLDCPKEETARVRSGENEQSVRDQSVDEAPKSSHSEYYLDVYGKSQSLPLNERRQ